MNELNNLRAEMARSGVSNSSLQAVIGCSPKTVINKLSGATPFTISEALRVRDALFPGLRLEYLFQRDESPASAALDG